MSVRDAIILAAGMGQRLRAVVDDRPKGLIQFGGESLVGRSVRLLKNHGIERITLVAGYRAEQYVTFAGEHTDARGTINVLMNAAFATSGSMASLAVALDQVRGVDMLVLESDIVYEERAIERMLAASERDVTLVSGVTGAGDEVWVDAPGGFLRAMSKSPADLLATIGEFVGITRLSADGAEAMRAAFDRFTTANGHQRMDYETGALVAVAHERPVAALLVPDLCWGEIDDERHFARVSADVWPHVQ